ncbi:unnamed protein product [Rotaria sp. Silwood2]|nr:unnamed protein product [Rotaria sp. Silwood2]CAF2509591.1 unnamed protein product [Rotaria sp. Silwood2]CAF2741859.1 unnamed protein product [Rotaria sp. Silwood2]CAF2882744.1 unnamed protein product [Rotaria sp. Silwood2]CAF3977211.1 unnamed protein product [Rotaria sp. Silwood2]
MSRSLPCNDTLSAFPINHTTPNNAVEQLHPEIFLPPSSSLGPGTLLITRDGEDDVNSVRINTTRTSTTELEYSDTMNKSLVQSKSKISNGSNSQKAKKNGCDILVLLKSCWSWFCGLDGSDDVDNQDELTVANVSYHCLQQKIANDGINEGNDSMLQHIKEQPIIKWILNGNLVFIILVEITLFTVFSLPAKYTFLRN